MFTISRHTFTPSHLRRFPEMNPTTAQRPRDDGVAIVPLLGTSIDNQYHRTQNCHTFTPSSISRSGISFSTIAQKPRDADIAFVPFLGTSAVPHDLHWKTMAILMYLIVILSILLNISTLLSKPR